MGPVPRKRSIAGLAGVAFLAACASGAQLGDERAELENFRLGHAVVVASEASLGPASRRAAPEEWEETLTREIKRRFDRYEGDRLYHIAVNVQGYVLAIPGIPIVAAPRSVLIIGVTIWDDAAEAKLNNNPHRITVLESMSGETVVGSGLTQSSQQQMRNLSQNAVAAIERWMATKPEWFPAPDIAQAESAPQAQGTAP
ncbi:MAG: hypothetical protein JJT99_09185 [Rhodobacteraceae bacterium]|nr:hypothetical protein [Paracoccaceae bacterium]